MEFCYYGHACFSVCAGGKNILFDPFISGNPLARDIDIQKIKADYILISHGHGDHVADLMTIAKNTKATVVANYEIAEWVRKQGYENVHPINFGSKEFDFGMLRFVPAHHSSSMPDGANGGNPGGYLLTTTDGCFYFAGDTSLSMEMQLIPVWGKLNFAILPIGGNFTMDAEDAVRAAEMIDCKKIVGIHFDTFDLIKIDHANTKALFQNAGLDLILPEIGQTLDL